MRALALAYVAAAVALTYATSRRGGRLFRSPLARGWATSAAAATLVLAGLLLSVAVIFDLG